MSVDGFAAATALGALGQRSGHLRIAFVFGLAALALPLAGMALGAALSGFLARLAGWIGVAALVALGLATVARALRGDAPADPRAAHPAADGLGLLLLAGSLGLDNLVIGLGLGLHGTGSWLVGPTAGGFTFAATLLGLRTGVAGRRQWGTRATIAAGLLLILIGALLAAGVI
jgi:manganese efflux pump family protein